MSIDCTDLFLLILTFLYPLLFIWLFKILDETERNLKKVCRKFNLTAMKREKYTITAPSFAYIFVTMHLSDSPVLVCIPRYLEARPGLVGLTPVLDRAVVDSLQPQTASP
jgi:hypothetical protein